MDAKKETKKIAGNADLINAVKKELRFADDDFKTRVSWWIAVLSLPFLLDCDDYFGVETQSKLLKVFRSLDSAALSRYFDPKRGMAVVNTIRKDADNLVERLKNPSKASLSSFSGGMRSTDATANLAERKISSYFAMQEIEVRKSKDDDAADLAEKTAKAKAAGYADIAAAYAVLGNDNVIEIAGSANSAAGYRGIALDSAIKKGLHGFKKGASAQWESPSKPYDDVWKKSLDGLREIGCGYWAEWYENLFAEGFTYDENELLHRLTVPDKIRKQGASAVGEYMAGYKN